MSYVKYPNKNLPWKNDSTYLNHVHTNTEKHRKAALLSSALSPYGLNWSIVTGSSKLENIREYQVQSLTIYVQCWNLCSLWCWRVCGDYYGRIRDLTVRESFRQSHTESLSTRTERSTEGRMRSNKSRTKSMKPHHNLTFRTGLWKFSQITGQSPIFRTTTPPGGRSTLCFGEVV